MLAVSMPNFATSSALVETATKCLRDRLLVAELRQAPGARGVRRWSSSRAW